MSETGIFNLFRDAGKTREIGLDVLLSMLDEDTRTRLVKHASVRATFAAAGIASLSPADELVACIIAYMGWDVATRDEEGGAK